MSDRHVIALFAPEEGDGGRKAFAARVQAIRPDRVLTADEEMKRDLLIRLILDRDGTDIPLPPIYTPRPHQHITLVRFRRQAAARMLGVHLAHDTMVEALTDYLNAGPPVLREQITDIAVQSEEHATQLSLLASEYHTREGALRALAQSGSRDAIPTLVRMTLDPQLYRHAREYLRRLLVPHVRARVPAADLAGPRRGLLRYAPRYSDANDEQRSTSYSSGGI